MKAANRDASSQHSCFNDAFESEMAETRSCRCDNIPAISTTHQLSRLPRWIISLSKAQTGCDL